MNDTTNNGGPAFPVGAIEDADAPGCFHGGYTGMTLRDYFAGQAISQIIATCAHDTTYGMTRADYFAGRAYEIADAMLKARGEAE